MAERRSSPLSGDRMSSMEIDGSEGYTMRPRAPLITRYPPLKTTLMAAFLLIVGSIFLIIGACILWASLINNGKDRGISLMVLGGLSKFFFHQPFSPH
jgi:hypothetical protein